MNIPQGNVKSEQSNHYKSMLLITVVLCFSGVITTGYMLSTSITIGDDKSVAYNNSMLLVAFFSISILLGIFALPIVYNDYNDIVFSSTVSINKIIIPISTLVNGGLILNLVTFFLSVTLYIVMTH
jgi:hypothetical protein